MHDPADLMRSLPKGCGMELVIEGAFTKPKIRTADEVKALFDDPTKRSVISMVMRPGAAFFTRYMELKHYPPGSPKEPQMRMLYLNLGEMLFSVTFIPAEDEHLIPEVATATRMEAKKGHQMYGSGEGGLTPMIHNIAYCYVLENLTGDLAYKDTKAAYERQDTDVEALEAEWEVGRRQFVQRQMEAQGVQ